MDIEVNEYVRTNKGVIGKLISETLSYPEPSEWILKANNNKIVIVECNDYPVKHSKQLIDLIEVGDYVNGYRVEQASIETNEVLLDHNGFGWRTLKDGDKIVTHEQFESIEYKVEEENNELKRSY